MRDKRKVSSALLKAVLFILVVTLVTVFNSGATKLLCKVALISAGSFFPYSEKAPSQVRTPTSQLYVSQKNELPSAIQSTVTAVKNETLAVVDSDIEKLIEKARTESVNDKADGEIVEYTFTNDGVTDVFGNVKVKNTNETDIDIEKKLAENLDITLKKKDAAVLIYHTHTTETYQLLDRDFYARGFLSRSNDENLNMIRVGKAIKEEIEKMGFTVIHDTAVYDNPYTGAYSRSAEGVKAHLEKHPSIKITLDIHRDAIQNDSGVKTKPVAVINGKKAAQVMIITGCQEEGNGITDLPGWENNLTFALKLQQSMETLFPGLTRPVYFCARSYNMGLTPYSLLIEMGTDANTLDEAVYSGKMLGRAVGSLLEQVGG